MVGHLPPYSHFADLDELIRSLWALDPWNYRYSIFDISNILCDIPGVSDHLFSDHFQGPWLSDIAKPPRLPNKTAARQQSTFRSAFAKLLGRAGGVLANPWTQCGVLVVGLIWLHLQHGALQQQAFQAAVDRVDVISQDEEQEEASPVLVEDETDREGPSKGKAVATEPFEERQNLIPSEFLEEVVSRASELERLRKENQGQRETIEQLQAIVTKLNSDHDEVNSKVVRMERELEGFRQLFASVYKRDITDNTGTSTETASAAGTSTAHEEGLERKGSSPAADSAETQSERSEESWQVV
ncbi:hypothetical protein HK102_010134 [Quaeritorhiza haematococci]|nr:hypothetical protein HK102_010134 [Quaeritorhiza haematococci]